MPGTAHTWTDGDVATAAFLNALPRGIMGQAVGSSSDQTGITTATDITGLSVTFTAIASRYYKTTINVSLNQITNAATVTLHLMDGSSTIIRRRNLTIPANSDATMTLVYVETGLSGTITRKGNMFSTASSLTVRGAALHSCTLVVEDIGA